MKIRYVGILGIIAILSVGYFGWIYINNFQEQSLVPYSDPIENHLEDLKKIPQVEQFYKVYADQEITIISNTGKTYHIEFQVSNENVRSKLYIYYDNYDVKTVRYTCMEYQTYDQYLEIHDAQPSDIKNCIL